MSELLPSRSDAAASAIFSPCRTWRYTLERRWGDDPLTLVIVGLNPSTADETQDDPTIRRCIGFARSWGYGRLLMLNLFAYRATDPREMLAAADPIGPDNPEVIGREAGRALGSVLCAWGVHGAHLGWGPGVLERLGSKAMVLGLTKDGHPKHPLYLRADTQPSPLSVALGVAP